LATAQSAHKRGANEVSVPPNKSTFLDGLKIVERNLEVDGQGAKAAQTIADSLRCDVANVAAMHPAQGNEQR
jgi:hypothetical protein